ncbi:hypothetical protein A1A1_16595 [Planococcus antarcticus DSM 14505]|uniref:Uncharacterized protein n=1 Tax=Planococcus antarcticus DSM 14505 TaxID=1185653 RepID=A0AA87IJ51_9BACL|nr:hypothetical protein A1A1_16595 [Planococcus antarcticus DSM 14505]
MNNTKKEAPKINGINLKASILPLEVVQLEAPAGLESMIAIPSPLAPNIKNKIPKHKKAVGIPNNLVILFFILFSPRILKSGPFVKDQSFLITQLASTICQ